MTAASRTPTSAGEHDGASLANEVPDGPEHAADESVPAGLAGAEPDEE
jgi:hypothetical protein